MHSDPYMYKAKVYQPYWEPMSMHGDPGNEVSRDHSQLMD